MPRDPARNPIDDRIRAQHMLDAARDVETIARDQGTEDLRANMPMRRALLNAIQEIGEARPKSHRLGVCEHPRYPRESVVGMRNCLVHGYDKINLEVVWKAATEEIHPIIAALESAFVCWPLADAPRP